MLPLLMLAALSAPVVNPVKMRRVTSEDLENEKRRNQERIEAAQRKRDRKAAIRSSHK